MSQLLTKVLLYTVKCCHSDAPIFKFKTKEKKYTKDLFSKDSM